MTINSAGVLDALLRFTVVCDEQRRGMADGPDWPVLIDVIDSALGLAVFVICLMRMGRMNAAHKIAARVAHAALMTGGFCLALAPLLFGPVYTRLGSVLFALSVLAYMLAAGASWRKGKPPRCLERQRLPLQGARDAR